MTLSTDSRTVQVVDDGSDTPVTIVVSDALAGALARAAIVNKGQDDFALSFSSLFIGLLAGTDPIGEWLTSYSSSGHLKVSALLQRRNLTLASFESLRADHPALALLGEPLRRTSSARSALDEADRIRRDAGNSSPAIDTRHVIAAFIALPQYHEADFRSLGVDRPAWGRDFVPQVAKIYSSEASFWSRWYAGAFPAAPPLPAMAPADPNAAEQAVDRGLWHFAPDVDSQKDLLGVEREAHGLASLIASHGTTLPLSIGLFGQWGSGKTFFMRQIQDRVRTICREAQKSGKPQSEIAFFKHVAQIEFNAWHYSEGELLPSLVEHILQNLRTDEQESEEQVQQRRALLLTQIADERREAAASDEQIRTAQGKVDEKQIEIDTLRDTQDKERRKIANNLTAWAALDTFQTAVTLDASTQTDAHAALTKLGVPALGDSARELQASLGRARTELSGAGALLLPLLRGEGRTTRTVYLLLAFAAPMIVGAAAYWVLAPQGDLIATAAAWIARITAFVAAGAAWLQKQTSWVAARRREIEAAKQAVDASIERQTRELQANHARELAEGLQELERLRAEHTALVRERDERARAIENLETTLARTSSTFLLNQFIMDRQAATDYRKLLGFMALIRRDFDKLSALIERSNRAIVKGEAIKVDTDPRLNRIVLYIDDLDRCPEDKVVNVLRAVHLLLAFPLFVVVVAVDSRWLTRCLKAQYQSIFGGTNGEVERGAATPLDYLEKIFQIPLWLRPLNEQQRADMVRALLREGQHDGKAIAEPQAGGLDNSPKPDRPSNVKPELEAPADQQAHNSNQQEPLLVSTSSQHHEAVHTPTFDLNPTGLTITDHEWEFVDRLKTLPLSQTPRVLKRFANTYRLIKSALPPDEQETFKVGGDSAPFTICMFQLAVLTSSPEFAPHYLRAMRSFASDSSSTVRDWTSTLDTLFDLPAMKPYPTWYSEGQEAEWRRLYLFFQHSSLRRAWDSVPITDYSHWATRASRFTFAQE
jgi:hypothetical protein